LRERFSDAIHHTFGIDPGALTANEANYLSGFRTADELRNRPAKAAEEIDRRLRAKGFQLETRPAALIQVLAKKGMAGRQPAEAAIEHRPLSRWQDVGSELHPNGRPKPNAQGVSGADDRVDAALDLQVQLLKIHEAETQDDMIMRWKPLHQQPIGWDPDINDDVRLNIRPFLAPIPGAPSAGDSFDDHRWNDPHDTRAAKEAVRARHAGGES
jgi:hypothetical protein